MAPAIWRWFAEAGDIDRLLFGPGIDPASVSLSRPAGTDTLVLTIGAGGDRVVLTDQFATLWHGVELVAFADGTVWTRAQMEQMLLSALACSDAVGKGAKDGAYTAYN